MIVAILLSGSAPALAVEGGTGAAAASRDLGVIKGVVRDQAGKPIADATVALFRMGTTRVLREVRSAADGSFLMKIIPGTYKVLAVAQGYNAVTIMSVEVARSTELNYGFKLERAGSGNTLPERRLDRSNPKWAIRSSQAGRTVYQNSEGNSPVESVATSSSDITYEIAPRPNEDRARPGQSVVETYFASSKDGNFAGLNYATMLPLGEKAEVLLAVQAGVGRNAPQRVETKFTYRPHVDHQLRFNASAGRYGKVDLGKEEASLGQVSFQALDEWRVREGVVFVYGFDYSRFVGAGSDQAISPRLGFQYDIDSKTRFRTAYTSQTEERTWAREIELEDAQVMFRDPMTVEDIVVEDGVPVMNRSSRLEFGVERILSNRSSIEANAFFDSTAARGVGLAALPQEGAGIAFNEFTGNQQGTAAGLRVVYSRRLSDRLSTSGGYSFGTGQQLSAAGVADPSDLFRTDLFHAFFGQIEADLKTGTTVRTIFRFSPDATIFAIDPFRGRVAIYDPSLSVMVTQSLPSLGLPIRAEATLDARNLFDQQTAVSGDEGMLRLAGQRRMLRGGILVRF
jgi:hypothetical protein